MPKKQKKPKKPNQVWKLYEKKGEEIIRKNKTCPKCGAGVYLAAHKGRVTCGKCGYMEKVAAAEEAPKEKKEEKKEAKPEEK